LHSQCPFHGHFEDQVRTQDAIQSNDKRNGLIHTNMYQRIHYIHLAMGQNLKHIRIYNLGFFTCMVGKGLLLISQGKLEPNEIFIIKPCNPTDFFWDSR
jgi:hypothetical protein